MEMYGEEWAARFEELADAGIPGRAGLFRIADACLADLPEDARLLIVGCGTGTELLQLAVRHPSWRFEAVEPAKAMLRICSQRLESASLLERARLHQRPLAGLRIAPCHAATAILVSQHVVDDVLAADFFRDIAANLTVDGRLFSADISAPAEESARDRLLRVWRDQATTAGIPAQGIDEMRSKFGRDLHLRSPAAIESLLEGAGFSAPLPVFQSLIYRAWSSRKRE